MKKIKEYILTALKTKRVQGIIALVLIHFFPDLNVSVGGVDLHTAAIGWLGYGILSADSPALPKLKTLIGK